MFRYFCNLFLKYNRDIYPIVIFSYDRPKRAATDNFQIYFPDKQVLKFDYQVLQLNRLNWRDFLRQNNPVAIALMSKMSINKSDRPTVKAQCLRLLVTLKLDPAKMYLINGFIDTYLNLNEREKQVFDSELDKMNLQEKENIMQITNSWKEEGIVEGQSNTILRQLSRKFGTLDPSIGNRIKSFPPEQLDNLTEDLLDFQTLDDLNNWLLAH